MDVSPCSHFVAIGNLTGEVKLTKLNHSKSGQFYESPFNRTAALAGSVSCCMLRAHALHTPLGLCYTDPS